MPNLSVPCATVTTTLPRPQSSNTCSARSMTRALLPTGGRVRTWPPNVPADESKFPPDPFGQANLCPDPADVVIYSDITEIHAELRDLGEARKQYRFNRWAITDLWIVTIGAVVILACTGWWPLGLVAAAFALYAVRLADGVDISAERGRELDADIAAAKGRLREKLEGEGSS